MLGGPLSNHQIFHDINYSLVGQPELQEQSHPEHQDEKNLQAAADLRQKGFQKKKIDPVLAARV